MDSFLWLSRVSLLTMAVTMLPVQLTEAKTGQHGKHASMTQCACKSGKTMPHCKCSMGNNHECCAKHKV